MTKRHHSRQSNYGMNIKPMLDTTVKVVEIGAVTTVGAAALGNLASMSSIKK